jgi:PadR family transcriptional regulator, regulatory protein PadR
MKDRHLYSGLVRLHILHHAVHGDVFGMGLMEELRRHGYRLSAGTLYPILHGMEKSGYLVSRIESVDGRQRRVYTATSPRRGDAPVGQGQGTGALSRIARERRMT